MQVRLGGNAAADVEELTYALGGQVRHRAAHEAAVGPDVTNDGRPDRDDRFGRAPIGVEIVLAAEPVVIDASRVSNAGVDQGPLVLRVLRTEGGSTVCLVTRHNASSFLARKASVRPKFSGSREVRLRSRSPGCLHGC